ncbi:hypothetical protein DM01DRAFT_1378371 [Hesseltinella vesiculosa]|uniref:F-box domain-containing protein n=1 Tax=Hesseltinella vesiculosa TaxID=101127 RepID=A0A1X2G4J9_9FUNG|nr:hypothetical protein DM01DRAFT_1378371 [Hesseltinella vesiculosa]
MPLQLLDLPNELFLLICQHLTTEECKLLRTLQRRWGLLLRPAIFRELSLVLYRPLPPSLTPYMINPVVSKLVATMNQWRASSNGTGTLAPVNVGHYLHEITLLDATINLKHLCQLVAQCDQLVTLTVSYNALYLINWKLLGRMHWLLTLPRPHTNVEIDPCLPFFFQLLGQQHLQHLTLRDGMTNHSLLATTILPHLPHLRQLDMKGIDIHEVNLDFLTLVQQHCPLLEVLTCPTGVRYDHHHVPIQIDQFNGIPSLDDRQGRLLAWTQSVTPWTTLKRLDLRTLEEFDSWVLFFIFLRTKMPVLTHLHWQNIAYRDPILVHPSSTASFLATADTPYQPQPAVPASFIRTHYSFQHLQSFHAQDIPLYPYLQLMSASPLMVRMHLQVCPFVDQQPPFYYFPLSSPSSFFPAHRLLHRLVYLHLDLEPLAIQQWLASLEPGNNYLTQLIIHARTSISHQRLYPFTSSDTMHPPMEPIHLDKLLSHCPLLRRLHIHRQQVLFADQSLQTGRHSLRELTFSYVQLADSLVLVGLSRQCPKLSVVRIRHVHIKDPSLPFPNDWVPPGLLSLWPRVLFVAMPSSHLVSLVLDGYLPEQVAMYERHTWTHAWRLEPTSYVPKTILKDDTLLQSLRAPPSSLPSTLTNCPLLAIISNQICSFRIAHFKLIQP